MRSTTVALACMFVAVIPVVFSKAASAVEINEFGAYVGTGYNGPSEIIYYQTPPGGTLITGVAADSHSDGPVFAQSDLATATLRASGSCEPQLCIARAAIVDTLAFDLSNIVDPFEIDFSAYVHGTFAQGTQPRFDLAINYGSTSVLAGVGWHTNQGTDLTASPEEFLVFLQMGDFDVFGPDLFSGSLFIDPAQILDTSAPFLIQVAMDLRADGNFDFSNTAGFNLVSPIPYTSASGVFLTGITSVPEPASMALFGSGLLALGLLSRRRKAA